MLICRFSPIQPSNLKHGAISRTLQSLQSKPTYRVFSGYYLRSTKPSSNLVLPPLRFATFRRHFAVHSQAAEILARSLKSVTLLQSQTFLFLVVAHFG